MDVGINPSLRRFRTWLLCGGCHNFANISNIIHYHTVMAHIITYLTFAGNCREAMEFYRSCLGGTLEFQTIGESPLAGSMPQEMRDCILHSTLTSGPLMIMASDMVGERGLIRGNAVSLMLDCNAEAELRTCFVRLADGGSVTHELEVTFWGALFGDLTDRYGNQWLLHFDKAKNTPVS